MYINSIEINPDHYPSGEYYTFNLDIFQKKQKVAFDHRVTFFIGENGTGKSTLLRAIALKSNIHIWENSGRTQVHYNKYTDDFYKYIDISFSDGMVSGSFFGAEIFRHFAELLDEWAQMDPALLNYFGGQSLTTKSHGQCNMTFFETRFTKNGLYLLDEPESALSPKTQIEIIKIISHPVQQANTQFIIATHSPLLMALPGSSILSFDHTSIKELAYEETEYYRIYKRYLDNPDNFLTI